MSNILGVQISFQKGAIHTAKIAELLEQFAEDTSIGAHNIFIGQIRDDKVKDSKVVSIYYDANEAVAELEFEKIRTELLEKFDVKSIHVSHSLGDVSIGDICLLVIVGTAHRSQCQSAVDWLVEAIKSRLPIFAKEVLEDQSYVWKVNTPKVLT